MAIINSVISGGGSAPTQFGVNLKGWCGDINPNDGLIRTDQAVGTLSMPQLTSVTDHLFYSKFNGSSGLTGTVDLSAVTGIDPYGMVDAFRDTSITGVDLRSLQYVGEAGMNGAFANTNIATLELTANQLDGDGQFVSMCQGCLLLKNVYIYLEVSNFLQYAEDYGFLPEEVFGVLYGGMIEQGPTNCVVHFYDDFVSGILQWYDDQGETSPYSTTQGWADYIAGFMDYDFSTHGNTVVFDISQI